MSAEDKPAPEDQPEQQKTHEIWPSSEDVEQSFRNANVLSCRQGGGVVFPSGLLGTGFRVDQQTFERYGADLAENPTSVSPLKSKLVTAGYFAVALAFVFGMVLSGESIAVPPLYWADLVFLVAVSAYTLHKVLAVHRGARDFLLRYSAVGIVRPGAFLRRRLLGLIAAGVHNIWRSLFSASIFLFIGLGQSRFWEIETAPWSWTLLSFGVMAIGFVALCFVLAHIGFRLLHGRPPSTDDLEPV